jgi:DNA-binding CsgD family transcriptional regulator
MLNHEPDELSEREREILRLVATGASNKEIAQQLVISPNTVKVHLRNIFGKIGAASRTEAAMYAVRNRLVQGSVEIQSSEIPLPAALDQIPISISEPDTPKTDPIDVPIAKDNTFWGNLQSLKIIGGLIVTSILVVVALIILPRLIPNQQAPFLSGMITDSNQRWLEAEPMAIARYLPAAVTYEGSIYIIGGANKDGTTGSMMRFNPNTDEWFSMPEKPLPVSEIQAAVLADRIYVPGGKTADQTATNRMELYNPQTNEWETGPALPTPISAYSLVTFEGKMYLFGGWDGQTYTADVYEYNPDESKWRFLTKMESPRAFSGSVVIGNHIYIAGGKNEEGSFQDILVFRPSQGDTGAWDASIQMPSERYASGVSTLADSIYIIGGKTDQGEHPSPWQFNPQSKEWYTFEPPELDDWSHMAAVPLQNLIYTFGGEVDGESTAFVLKFQALYTLAIPVVR